MNVAKRRQISTIQALSLAAVVAILIGVYQIRWQPHDSNGVVDAVSSLNGQWVDRSAPYFELVDLEGRVHRLSEYRGKVIFLNFWASFCEPCRREMPSMEALVRQYEPQGMVMLAVSVDPESDDIRKFMEEFLPGQRSAMTVLWDPESRSSASYGTELLPETYIVGRDGRIVARFVNAYDWMRPEVKRLIEALLREQGKSTRLL